MCFGNVYENAPLPTGLNMFDGAVRRGGGGVARAGVGVEGGGGGWGGAGNPMPAIRAGGGGERYSSPAGCGRGPKLCTASRGRVALPAGAGHGQGVLHM